MWDPLRKGAGTQEELQKRKGVMQPFAAKIIRVVKNLDFLANPWDREAAQRDAMVEALNGIAVTARGDRVPRAEDADILVVADVDEIIKPKVAQTLRNCRHLVGDRHIVSSFPGRP